MAEAGGRAPLAPTPLSHDRHLGELGGGTQGAQRLLAYSDALFSIIATVMILPVAHTKIHPDQKLGENVQQLLATKIAVYLMTFLIVTVAWAAHVRLFQVVELIDDVLALANLACMMSITFLPYTFSLMASFPEEPFGLFIFSSCAVVFGVIQVMIVLYGFRHSYLLNHQIQESENKAFYKYHILKIILRGPTLSFLAAIFSFFFFPLSYMFLGLIIFFPLLSHLTKWFRSRILGQEEELPVEYFTSYLKEPLSKERVESFTDGVYAIVATLLILDICEDNVPDNNIVNEKYNGHLAEALREFGPSFLAYFGSFVTIGLLWFVHHSLFLHVTKATRLMSLLNTLSLAFIGGLPLAYQLTSEFAEKSYNEIEAIQISCVTIFFASIFQFSIWIAALFHEVETLHPFARWHSQRRSQTLHEPPAHKMTPYLVRTARYLLFPERACVLNGLVRHIRFSFGREEKMIPPVEVSPLIKFCRYSALLLGIIYGARRYAYLKPIAAEDRRKEAEERAKQEELKRIAKALEEAQESILK